MVQLATRVGADRMFSLRLGEPLGVVLAEQPFAPNVEDRLQIGEFVAVDHIDNIGVDRGVLASGQVPGLGSGPRPDAR